jgi:hypothetical protein
VTFGAVGAAGGAVGGAILGTLKCRCPTAERDEKRRTATAATWSKRRTVAHDSRTTTTTIAAWTTHGAITSDA